MEARPVLIRRRSEAQARELLADFRIVIVNGPRQSGKSTLLSLLAVELGATVITLDDRQTLRAARTDPTGLLESYDRPLFIDEVQRGGDPLVLAIKAEVDRNSQRPGQFVLAGSSRFLTVPTLSESLAGRAAIVDLLPLAQAEIDATDGDLIDRLFVSPPRKLRASRPPVLDRSAVMARVVRGGFPEVVRLTSERSRSNWFANYRRQMIDRDIAELRRIRQGIDAARLLRVLAARTGQELNIAAVARDAGLGAATTREYLALFETIYLHRLVPAWSTNLTSRVKHHPKLYLTDSGLAAAIVGSSTERLASALAPMAGELLETFVVSEVAAQLGWAKVRAQQFHFRDRDQREVDIVVEANDGRVVGIEVKAARDVDESDFRWLAYLRDRVGERFVNGVVLHIGERPLPFGDRLTALPVSALWT